MEEASISLSAVTGGFRYSPGTELSSPERAMLRRQNAGSALVSALAAEPSWWAHVQAVRQSSDPSAHADQLSKRYAARARRRPIAALMVAAAGASTQRAALAAMAGLLASACFVPDEAGRRSTYAMGDAFMLSILRGAGEIAQRGRAVATPDRDADEDVRRVLDLAGPAIVAASLRRPTVQRSVEVRRPDAWR